MASGQMTKVSSSGVTERENDTRANRMLPMNTPATTRSWAVRALRDGVWLFPLPRALLFF